jgi:hypothetical protein
VTNGEAIDHIIREAVAVAVAVAVAARGSLNQYGLGLEHCFSRRFQQVIDRSV